MLMELNLVKNFRTELPFLFLHIAQPVMLNCRLKGPFCGVSTLCVMRAPVEQFSTGAGP